MRSLTLQEVARQVALSPSFLSMLERGQADIALSRISRLALFYGVTASDLLMEEDATARPSLVLPHDGTLIDRGPGVAYRLLWSGRYGVQVAHVSFAPRSGFRDVLAHTGQDFCWVIRGELVLLYGGDEYVAQAGQMVTYEGAKPHAFRNDGHEPAEMIGFINPPYW